MLGLTNSVKYVVVSVLMHMVSFYVSVHHMYTYTQAYTNTKNVPKGHEWPWQFSSFKMRWGV